MPEQFLEEVSSVGGNNLIEKDHAMLHTEANCKVVLNETLSIEGNATCKAQCSF